MKISTETSQFALTGGAGFIGSNLAAALIDSGKQVTILDNLSRPGSPLNLAWLNEKAGKNHLKFIKGDVGDFRTVVEAVADAQVIFHLAAQVAVTTSIENPVFDFEVNVRGALNVLEAARRSPKNPVVIVASTNKVYGNLSHLNLYEEETRYASPELPYGVSETCPLEFCSPYGCSKGAMDQYTLDYHRTYGMPTVVLRLSCIYGERQFGTEDQGWVAHLMRTAAEKMPINIYGDGKQVRDLLHVEDLVHAFDLAIQNIDRTAGQAYNIGGGQTNSLSVWNEFEEVLSSLSGNTLHVRFRDWRTGDQRFYISDYRKFAKHTGWDPAIPTQQGLERLWKWVLTIQDPH